MQQLDATSYLALPPDVPGFTVTSLDHCHALYMDDGSYVRVAVIDHYPYWIQCANCDVPDQCACRWAEYPQTSLHYTKTNEMSEQEMINKKLVDYYYSFSSNYPHYQLNNDIVTEVHTNIESSANEENVKHIHIPLDGLLNSAANIKETLDTEVKSKGADDSETDGIKEIIHTVHKDTGTAKIKEVKNVVQNSIKSYLGSMKYIELPGRAQPLRVLRSARTGKAMPVSNNLKEKAKSWKNAKSNMLPSKPRKWKIRQRL